MHTVFDDIKRRLTPRKRWQGPQPGYEYCAYSWWLSWVNHLQEGECSLEENVELMWMAKYCDRPTFLRLLVGKA